VIFRRERDGVRRVMSLDEMLAHLDAWDRTADRRMSERRIAALARREIERRMSADRRAEESVAEHRRRAMDHVASDAGVDDAPEPGAPVQDTPRTPHEPSGHLESEVALRRSAEPRVDREAGPERSRQAAPASAPHEASRHAH
jgi:hypothetical protein